MPPRSTPPPTKRSFAPPNDSATYRDLLLFEERLKTTAASLQRRKARYQLFLFQLLVVIAFLLGEVLLPTRFSLLTFTYKRILFLLGAADVDISFHPYLSSGMLFVSVTTLVLFFASGMYSEKIAYANKYVPHANRALRSFNMYLNVRQPPLRSRFSFNPLSMFFQTPVIEPPSKTRVSSRSVTKSTSVPIAPIPPASTPRGELIFSSRIDRSFRDSYERYRAAFERRRLERQRMAQGLSWWQRLMFWRPPPTPVASHVRVPSNVSRPSRSGTPPSVGNGSGNGPIMMRHRDRSHSPGRTVRALGSTPPSSKLRE